MVVLAYPVAVYLLLDPAVWLVSLDSSTSEILIQCHECFCGTSTWFALAASEFAL